MLGPKDTQLAETQSLTSSCLRPAVAPMLSSWSAKDIDSDSVEKKLPLVPPHQPPKCPPRSDPDTKNKTAEPGEKGAPISHRTRQDLRITKHFEFLL